jgi:tetratricopeptide (TPR) repeat protein
VDNRERPAMRKLFKPQVVAILGLAALCYFNFGLLSSGFGLHVDDWMWVNQERWGEVLYWILTERPLHGAMFALAYYLFGFVIPNYYLLLWPVHALTGVVLFLTLDIILKRDRLLSFFLSAIFTVYPAVLTRIWFATYGTHVGMFLCSLAFYALVRFFSSVKRRIWLYLLSLLLYFLGLMGSELPMALIGIAPLVIFLTDRGETCSTGQRWKSAFLWTAPFGGPVLLYAFYRFYLMPHWGLLDIKVVSWQLQNIYEFVPRMISGFKVLLCSSWELAAEKVLAPGHLPERAAMCTGVTLACGALSYLVYRLSQTDAQERGNLPGYRWTAGLFAAGILLVILGYLPIIPTIYYPELYFFASRVNYAASIGGAVLVVSVLIVVSRLLLRGQMGIYLFGLLGSILLGFVSTSNYVIQQEYVWAWRIQAQVWNNVLFIAPAVKDNTTFYLVGNYYKDYFIPILSVPWEVTNALQLLYNNPTLRGETLPYNQIEVPRSSFLESLDSRNPQADRSVLFLEYDDMGCVRLLRRLTDIRQVPRRWRTVASNTDNILLDPGAAKQPPARQVLGPRHRCWDTEYYSRAVIYGQRGMWAEVVGLYDEAMAKGDAPTSPDSLAVFLQALYELGKYDEARHLLEQVPAGNSAVLSELVDLSARYAAAGEKEKREEVDLQLVQLLPNPQSVNLGGLIEFLGYKGERLADGNYELDLYFRALQQIPVAYELFFRVALLNDPRGSAETRYTPFLPTTEWEVGQIVRETILERVPYNVGSVSFGFYSPADGKILKRQDNEEELVVLEGVR